LSTGDHHFDALLDARGLRDTNCRQAFILRLLASLAPLGFVSQSLVMEKDLFTCSPEKRFAAIDATYRAILKL